MTVVYTLSNQSAWANNELRYSIRSFVKYTAVNRIIIVGYLPDWLQGVEYIPFDDGPRKQLNIHLKTLAASQVCDEFIQAADDHFILAPTDFSSYYFNGLIRSKNYDNKYRVPVENTAALLPNGLFFNLHIPMKMQSDIYQRAMMLCNWAEKDYLIKSVYANMLYGNRYFTYDVKVSHFMRRDAIDKFVSGKGFLSVSDAGLSVDMKAFLGEKFPDKSIYER